MKRAVVIVAGGSGLRMGGEIPKQYQELEGLPLILHTLKTFRRFDPGMKVVVVVAQKHLELWNKMALLYTESGRIEVATGGPSRFHSVQNGLQLIEDGWLVGIHDAVRPFVSLDTLERCYKSSRETGSAIPVIDVDESVRMLDAEGRSSGVDRSTLKRVQTPQVFRSELIRQAYEKTIDQSFTDDASVYESHFGKVTLVEGNRENIKITTPTDMKLASLFIRSAE